MTSANSLVQGIQTHKIDMLILAFIYWIGHSQPIPGGNTAQKHESQNCSNPIQMMEPTRNGGLILGYLSFQLTADSLSAESPLLRNGGIAAALSQLPTYDLAS